MFWLKLLLNVVFVLPVITFGMFLPYFSRLNIIFGVAIPSEHHRDPEIRKLRLTYTIYNIIAAIVIVAAAFIGLWLHLTDWIVYTLPSLLYALVSFGVYIQFHGKAQRLKEKKKWNVSDSRDESADPDIRNEKNMKSLYKWLLLPLLIIVVNIVLLIVNYDQISNTLNSLYSSFGHSDSLVRKTPFILFFPNCLQVVALLLIVFAQSIIIRDKSYSNQQGFSHPNTEQVKRKRVAFISLLVISLVLIGMFSMIQLSMIGIMSALSAMIISVVFHIILLPIVLFFSVKSSWRVRIDRTNKFNDDKYWKSGIFYYNPEDTSIFIEKRVGLGYAFNYAHPLSWLLTFAPFLFIFVIVTIAIYFTVGAK